jgi:hypothetical protein
MAKASINNGFGRSAGFLSDIVKSEMCVVEVPNRTINPGDDWADHAPEPAIRSYGARSGGGKTLTTK